MTYTTEQIMTLIKEYQTNVQALHHLRKEYIDVVCGGNISQYGFEAALPKPQGQNSDPVLREVERLMRQDKMITRYEQKVLYIQNRWDRITDETQGIVFNQLLSGVSYSYIAKSLGVSKQRIQQIVMEISEILKD